MVNYIDLLACTYREGERGPKLYDCYGIVIELYRRDWKVEIHDPGTCADPTQNMARLFDEAAAHWILLPRPAPRCTVTFDIRGRAHIGYMLTDKTFIHCIQNRDVCIEPISNILWKNSITGFYQWKETNAPDL